MSQEVYLKKIKLKNVQNVDHAEYNFKPGFNFIGGENGSGKSTIMKAVMYVLSSRYNEKVSQDAKKKKNKKTSITEEEDETQTIDNVVSICKKGENEFSIGLYFNNNNTFEITHKQKKISLGYEFAIELKQKKLNNGDYSKHYSILFKKNKQDRERIDFLNYVKNKYNYQITASQFITQFKEIYNIDVKNPLIFSTQEISKSLEQYTDSAKYKDFLYVSGIYAIDEKVKRLEKEYTDNKNHITSKMTEHDALLKNNTTDKQNDYNTAVKYKIAKEFMEQSEKVKLYLEELQNVYNHKHKLEKYEIQIKKNKELTEKQNKVKEILNEYEKEMNQTKDELNIIQNKYEEIKKTSENYRIEYTLNEENKVFHLTNLNKKKEELQKLHQLIYENTPLSNPQKRLDELNKEILTLENQLHNYKKSIHQINLEIDHINLNKNIIEEKEKSIQSLTQELQHYNVKNNTPIKRLKFQHKQLIDYLNKNKIRYIFFPCIYVKINDNKYNGVIISELFGVSKRILVHADDFNKFEMNLTKNNNNKFTDNVEILYYNNFNTPTKWTTNNILTKIDINVTEENIKVSNIDGNNFEEKAGIIKNIIMNYLNNKVFLKLEKTSNPNETVLNKDFTNQNYSKSYYKKIGYMESEQIQRVTVKPYYNQYFSVSDNEENNDLYNEKKKELESLKKSMSDFDKQNTLIEINKKYNKFINERQIKMNIIQTAQLDLQMKEKEREKQNKTIENLKKKHTFIDQNKVKLTHKEKEIEEEIKKIKEDLLKIEETIKKYSTSYAAIKGELSIYKQQCTDKEKLLLQYNTKINKIELNLMGIEKALQDLNQIEIPVDLELNLISICQKFKEFTTFISQHNAYRQNIDTYLLNLEPIDNDKWEELTLIEKKKLKNEVTQKMFTIAKKIVNLSWFKRQNDIIQKITEKLKVVLALNISNYQQIIDENIQRQEKLKQITEDIRLFNLKVQQNRNDIDKLMKYRDEQFNKCLKEQKAKFKEYLDLYNSKMVSTEKKYNFIIDVTQNNYNFFVYQQSLENKQNASQIIESYKNMSASARKSQYGNNSGGENSIIFNMLRMSFMHVLKSPFIMLDEVNVFMDNNNRHLLYELFFKLLKEKKKQLFFLSPTSNHFNEYVKKNNINDYQIIMLKKKILDK